MLSPSSSEAFSSPSTSSPSQHGEDLDTTDCSTFLPSNKEDHIRTQLERLSMRTIDLIAKKRFSDPLLKCFSPNLKFVYEGVTTHTDRDSIFNQLAQVAKEYPEWRTEAVDALAEVDVRRGRAKVWMQLVERGLPGNIMRSSVEILCWERRDDNWMCWKRVGLSGVQMFS